MAASEFCNKHPQQKMNSYPGGGRQCPLCREEYYAANKEKLKQRFRSNNCNYTLNAISILGGKCAVCGEDDVVVLEFDHKNNNGKEHRSAVGATGGTSMPKWIISKPEEAKSQIQLLCANCHRRKHTALRHCAEIA